MKNTTNCFKIPFLSLIAAVMFAFTLPVNAQYEGAGNTTELSGGSWILTDVKQQVLSKQSLTAWTPGNLGVNGLCSWKDMIEIIHTVDAGFKWQEPPQSMPPGTYLNLEAVYTNNEYSTTGKVNLGIKMFFDAVGTNYMAASPMAIEVLRVSKDYKQYASEVKKGFFYSPKTLFDETNQCQLVIDCFIGKDHYVTTYTYTYQP